MFTPVHGKGREINSLSPTTRNVDVYTKVWYPTASRRRRDGTIHMAVRPATRSFSLAHREHNFIVKNFPFSVIILNCVGLIKTVVDGILIQSAVLIALEEQLKTNSYDFYSWEIDHLCLCFRIEIVSWLSGYNFQESLTFSLLS